MEGDDEGRGVRPTISAAGGAESAGEAAYEMAVLYYGEMVDGWLIPGV
jgi:hypothetical protein